MKYVKFIAIILLFPFVSSFEAPDASDSDLLYQKWVYEEYANNASVYKSMTEFDKGESGIAFFKDGRLIVRQNIGWCGTPPVTYGNYKGSWKKNSAGLIEIEHEYWGGTSRAKLRVVRLNKNELILEYQDVQQISDRKI